MFRILKILKNEECITRKLRRIDNFFVPIIYTHMKNAMRKKLGEEEVKSNVYLISGRKKSAEGVAAL